MNENQITGDIMQQLPLILSIAPDPRLARLPAPEQPVRRVSEQPSACNRVELLAALIGGSNQVETAEQLLAAFGSLRAMAAATPDELAAVRGVGPQRAVRVLAALELGVRLAVEVPEERPTIHSPTDAAALVLPEMSALEQEHLRVILLDTRNRVLEIAGVYQGSLNSAQVRIGEIFRPAIRRNAAALIVTHNHPSGDPTPSPDDVTVTRAIVQAGKLLDIQALDHLIVAGGRFISLKERGLGFST
jgi:DNA repair protein RadC